jgi:uncharacterized protein (DUF697 family)/tellurite resistance protein
MTTASVGQPKVAAAKSAFTGAPLSEKEALASLRVLICVAKASGNIAPDERAALENAVSQLEFPAGTTVKGLLDEKIDLEAQLRLFTTPESRDLLYQSALGMARLGGSLHPEEQKVLDRIRSTLQISEEKASLTRRIIDEARDTLLPSNIKPISDPALRTTEVKSDVVKYSVLTGVLGSFPIPGLAIATDLAVVAVQVKMVRDIGQRWGHKIDKQAAVSLMGGLGLGTGARIAVSNLAKLVPVGGSVVGATASFASTWALGKVADMYFESGMKTDMATLRSKFQTAQTEGRQAYAAQQEQVDAKREQHEGALKALNAELMAGKLNQQEYSARIEQLV